MSISSRLKLWVYLLLFVAVNSVLWWQLAAPYRFFPADDVTLIDPNFNPHIPAFVLSMSVVRAIWEHFSSVVPSALLVQALAANAITIVLLGLLIFRLTESVLATGAGLIIFITSTWTAGYYFMASYAPMAAAWALAAVYSAFSAIEGKRPWGFLITGAALALFLTTSSAAPVLTLVLGAVMIFRCWDWEKSVLRKSVAFALCGIFLVLLIFAGSIVPMIVHFEENVNSYHYQDALQRFGYIPKPPWFTFFRVGFVSSPVLFGTLILGLAFAGYYFHRRRGQLNAQDKTWLSLAAILIAHAFLLDLLPSTKLGRAHFPLLPLAIAFVLTAVVRIGDLIGDTRSRTPRILVGLVVLTIAVVAGQVTMDRQLLNARLGPTNLLLSQAPGTRFYVEPTDTSAMIYASALGLRGGTIAKMTELSAPPQGVDTVFIKGPHGPRSGRSVLRHSVIKDREFDPASIFKPKWGEEYKFPFYGYFPVFLMEEEISQALYFEGEAADLENPDLQLTIWKF